MWTESPTKEGAIMVWRAAGDVHRHDRQEPKAGLPSSKEATFQPSTLPRQTTASAVLQVI
jgi:hypothetical protein